MAGNFFAKNKYYAAYVNYWGNDSIALYNDILKYCYNKNIDFKKICNDYELNLVYDIRLIRTDIAFPHYQLSDEDIIDKKLKLIFKVKGMSLFTTRGRYYYNILGIKGCNSLLDLLSKGEIDFNIYKETVDIIEDFYTNNKFYNIEKMDTTIISENFEKLVELKKLIENVGTSYDYSICIDEFE
jgi:hypothetical protein